MTLLLLTERRISWFGDDLEGFRLGSLSHIKPEFFSLLGILVAKVLSGGIGGGEEGAATHASRLGISYVCTLCIIVGKSYLSGRR